MPAELRWEQLYQSITGAATYDAQSEFRNDSSSLIHIRKIRYSMSNTVLTDDQDGVVAISKSPTSDTLDNDNDTHFTLPIAVAGDSTTGPAVNSHNGGDSYGRGQLTLEPGESLYVNALSDGTGITYTYRFEIGYEF